MGEKMAEHDVGELWGEVEGLKTGFASLSKQVETGFKSLTETIRTSNEKTEARISSLDLRTEQRINEVASAQTSAQDKSRSNLLVVLGIVISSFLGVLSFGATAAATIATFYTLTKQPIDQSFAEMRKTTDQMQTDITTNRKTIDARFEKERDDQKEEKKNFVPKDEVKIVEERSKQNEAELKALGVAQATDRANASATANELGRVREDFKTARTVDGVSRAEFTDLKARVQVNEARTNAYLDKLTATPAYPCLPDSGAGCAPVKGPAPTAK